MTATGRAPSRRAVLGSIGGGALTGAAGLGLLTAPAALATDPATSPQRPSRPRPVDGVDHRRADLGRPAATTEKRVSDLLATMTLAEKIGQLVLTSLADQALAYLPEVAIGGLFSVVGAAQLNAVQKVAVEQTRLGIPIIFGLDVIHGYTTNFPIPLAQASSFDPTVAYTDAVVSAAEARASGIHWTYAPMMDVTREPRWGRIAEGSGEDPYLASQFAVAKVQGYQGDGYDAPDRLAACAKHYVAYGAVEGGRDYNTADISRQRLHNLYLPPFLAAVQAGVATVMAAFQTISGIPAHGNVYTLRDVLKTRYAFDGFVTSDYTGVAELIPHGYAADGAGAAEAALTAGVDMEMVSTTYLDNVGALISSGRLKTAVVDDAVRRLLRIKVRLGLFEHPYVDVAREVTSVSPANAARSRAAAVRSMVLLQNAPFRGRAVLPLGSDRRRVAVIGPLGDATYDLNGTWTGLGTGSLTTPPVTVVQGLTTAGKQVTFTPGCTVEGTSTAGFAAAVAAARAADVAVLVVGETAARSGEASSYADIGLPGVQEQLVRAVAQTGRPYVVVLVNGRPLTPGRSLDDVPAILEAWAPGVQGGNAIADVLTGRVNPGGKLPVSFPRTVGQLPIYYNHENTGRPPVDPANKYSSKYVDLPLTPQFAFGHGLSYTTFALSGLRVSSTHLASVNGSVDVTVDVRNTGRVAGDEVVQLYLRDPVASIVQPVLRLRGFERVTLAAGASATVTFRLTPSDVGFYDEAADFLVEKGLIELHVGTASDDLPLSSTLTVV